MNSGKDICNELKKVRRKIAEENDIELEIPECTHQGPCPGTCPRCEQEVRILERELAKRISLGKVATVAGLALALGAPAAMQAQEPQHNHKPREVRKPQAKLYPVSGTIIDAKTKEPLPFCTVNITPQGNASASPKIATTDFDGVFRTELPDGNYTLRVAYVGYKPIERPLKVTAKNDTIDIGLEMTAQVLGEAPQVIICGMHLNPIIEYDNNATNTEMQGVPLRVQY